MAYYLNPLLLKVLSGKLPQIAASPVLGLNGLSFDLRLLFQVHRYQRSNPHQPEQIKAQTIVTTRNCLMELNFAVQQLFDGMYNLLDINVLDTYKLLEITKESAV